MATSEKFFRSLTQENVFKTSLKIHEIGIAEEIAARNSDHRKSGQVKIAYTVPDKPQSRLQKYRLIAKGREYLKNQGA